MADTKPVVHIGENSPEEVAFKLLRQVAAIEKTSMYGGPGGSEPKNRKWLLDTYAECLEAVKGGRSWKAP